MNIYVSNLALSIDEDTLKPLFEEKGQVSSIKIIRDKFTRESRGFGFIEMPNKEEAEKAIKELNGSQLEGRTLRVNEAKPREEGAGAGGPRRSGGYGGRRDGGFDRGGNGGGGWGGGGGRPKRF